MAVEKWTGSPRAVGIHCSRILKFVSSESVLKKVPSTLHGHVQTVARNLGRPMHMLPAEATRGSALL